MPEPASTGILWRVSNAEKRLDAMERFAAEIPGRRDIDDLKTDIAELKEEAKNTKRATWAVFIALFGIGMSLAANVFAGSFT